MARLAQVVVHNYPHHVTQRCSRWQKRGPGPVDHQVFHRSRERGSVGLYAQIKTRLCSPAPFKHLPQEGFIDIKSAIHINLAACFSV